MPTGFVPDQDKGYLLVTAQLPDSASLERTQKVMDRIDDIVRQDPTAWPIASVISGQSFLLNANGSNFGSMFVILDEFEHRHGPDAGADAIAATLRQAAVPGDPGGADRRLRRPAGRRRGQRRRLQDHGRGPGSGDLPALQGQVDNLAEKANQQPGLAGVFSMFRANTPQLYLDIDRTKCKTMGVPLSDVFNALQVCLGGYYVNDFNEFDRTWQVNLQADVRVPAQAPGHREDQRPQRQRRHGPAEHAGQRPRLEPGRCWSTATTTSRPPRSTAAGPRASAPARR